MKVSISIARVLPDDLRGTVLASNTRARWEVRSTIPEGAGKDVALKVCGSTCHGSDHHYGQGRTRDQWTAVVNTMVSKGAKPAQQSSRRFPST